ncbi:hypothetical protein JN11_04737 [Mucilaginibacter frigoritolerans]|jgi:hypothetical protein|uniref:Uncharacterized protein n=1 Tax=Mucilaginibacter frigoritolerans TaxID=652788 RepID=A0A562TMS0_9SPHI|nr:hypothetical protein [Mucilaginibacter frigoritolerans]TWI94346.1 hypothetical protein JN11_04737 [Mucilaginibacter frigoritolerans]
MADLNKFMRTKDKLTETLKNLMRIKTHDERTDMYISHLQQSINIIDEKIAEFVKKELV